MGTGPIGVNAPAILPTPSQKIGFQKKLEMKTLLEDIYTQLSGLYDTEKKSIPNAIYMVLEGGMTSDSNSIRVTMKKPLSGAAVLGNAQAVGNEERPQTKTTTLYRNNMRKVVCKPGYGVRKLDADYLKLYEQHAGEDVENFVKEEEGLEIRQAFVERWGDTLVNGDTAAACVRNYHPNIFVCGLPLRSCAPTYSSNVANYTTNIVTSLIAAGGGSILPSVNQTANQPNLSNLSNFAMQRQITPLDIPGIPSGKGYILTISELQAVYLGDPAWSQRNLGSLYISYERLDERVQNWRGVIGAYKNMVIVVDPRQPTLNPTGSSAPFGLSAGYVWPGEIDSRFRDEADAVDTMFLHGKASLAKWDAEKPHAIMQEDDYGSIIGAGIARVYGVQRPEYDQAVPNAGSRECYGGILALCRIPDYV